MLPSTIKAVSWVWFVFCGSACSSGGTAEIDAGGVILDAALVVDAPDAALTFDDPCIPSACGAPMVAEIVQDITRYVNAFAGWRSSYRGVSGCISASEDVVTPTEFDLDIRQFDYPVGCDLQCQAEAGFLIDPRVSTATCLDRGTVTWDGGCSRVRLGAGRVRFRKLIDLRVTVTLVHPVLEVLPLCGTSCSEDMVTCPANQTCWETQREHCSFCLGGSEEVCACWTPDGTLGNGTQCIYWLSDDFARAGVCVDGRCALPDARIPGTPP